MRLPAPLRTVLLLLVAALPFASAPSARAAEPDYSGYEALLRRYIVPIGGKGAPYDTRFDYEQLYIDEDVWRLKRSARLDNVLSQLLAVDPATMTTAERTAWSLNAYNLLVVRHMTLNLLVPNRKFLRYDSPHEVRTPEGTFFASPAAVFGGERWSLTGFKWRFVYGDTTCSPLADGFMPRESGGDPRISLALVHGTIGTGPLLPWAYRADSLEAQLDRATRLALALPTRVRLDPKANVLWVSNRFFEDRADFGGPSLPALMPMLQKHAPSAVRRAITQRKLTRPDHFFEPNLKLNQYDHPTGSAPGGVRPDTTARR